MKWISELSASRAAIIAVGWPVVLVALAAATYAGVWLYWLWQARRVGSNASSEVTVTVKSWRASATLLIAPPVAFLFLWALLRAVRHAG